MTTVTTLIVLIIGVALVFDVINGFHDAANSVATIVATRVLRPGWAVAWTAFFNFIAFLVFPLHVAKTIGSGVIDPELFSNALILSALIGAIVFQLGTWWLGLPSSSSHALVGGLVGAGIATSGWAAVKVDGVMLIVAFIVVSPLIGLLLAALLMIALAWLFRRWALLRVEAWFRRLQLLSAAALSLGHGGNDAQKTMGIIFALLIAHHLEAPTAKIPLWIVLSCHAAMGLGTLLGGWRIVRTMGMRLTHLEPPQGFAAETGGAISLFLATALGIPVSTTHVIAGGIVGVGAVSSLGAVRWRVALPILWAWVLTIPVSALIAAGSDLVLRRALG